MKFLIRADASPSMGGGHVMRMLALAEALKAEGARAAFLSAPGTREAAPFLARADLAVFDARDPGAAIHAFGPVDVLIVDHFWLDAGDEAALRPFARKLAAIDDLARPHDADLVLDPTPGRTPKDYAALAPGALALTGPDYALLRPAFARLRDASLRRERGCFAPRRVFVSFGLTDAGGLTAATLTALAARDPGLALDVAVGASAPGLGAIRAAAAACEARLHIDATAVADLMAQSDLAVGAAGSASWERCALGLPAVAVAIAANQQDTAARLERLGAHRLIPLCATTADDLATAALGLLSTPARLTAMSAAAAAICDGCGAARAARALLDLATS